jgi:hypothetical protein
MLNIRRNLADWGDGNTFFPRVPYPVRSGARGQAIMTPYMTVKGHTRVENGVVLDNPRIPMWVWVTMDGQMQYGMRDGSVVNAEHLPVKADSYVNDFTFYEPERKLFFYTDSRRGAVVKGDRNTTPWTYSDLATDLGELTSCRAIGTTIYACDTHSGKVWAIDAATGDKRVLCTIPRVFWLDYTSTGKLVAAGVDWQIRLVDTETGEVSANIAGVSLAPNLPAWVQIDVDRNGTCGPVDTIYFVPSQSAGNIDFYRFFPKGDGTYERVLGGYGGYGVMQCGDSHWCQEPTGHYNWTVAIHPDEGCMAVGGFANVQIGVLGVVDPSDPFPEAYPYDHQLCGTGRWMIAWGGRKDQIGKVPSFTCFMGWDGDSFLGCTCDYMASMSYADMAAFIRGGMIGSVPRDLSNADLWPLGTYILMNSQRHLKEGHALIAGWKAFLGV